MHRLTRAVVLGTLTAAVIAAPAAAATKLTAIVGPGFNISLTKGGKKVTKLKPGTYTITVRDRSNIHNFRLKGKGVNKATSVPALGTKTWTVTLKKGTYTIICDPHPTSMKSTFKVG